MRSLNSWSLLLFLSTVTACSTQPSVDKLAKELKTVASWAATTHMVGDAWLRGRVPTAYAKRTLQSAQKELQKETNTLAKVAPAPDRTKALAQLEHLKYSIKQMTAAIEHEDRQAMTQQIQQLSSQEQGLSKLARTTGEQS